MRRPGAKARLREFFRTRVGEVVTGAQLHDAAGNVTEWARRVRELRDEEGWAIRTHNDSSKLRPGEYLLEVEPPSKIAPKFARNISSKLRAEVLDRNGFTCQMWGLAPGDIDPMTNRRVRLHIGHIKDKSLGGEDELANLRTLCSSCNQGAKNVTSMKPEARWLLAQVRRAGLGVQREVFDWLQKKFEK